MRQRLDEPFLDRVEGVRLVAQQPIRDAVGVHPVAAKQLLQRRPLAAGEPDKQLLILPGSGLALAVLMALDVLPTFQTAAARPTIHLS